MPVEGPRYQAHGTTNSPGGIPRLLVREKLDQHGCSSRISAKILAQLAIKRQFWAIVSTQGELFRAYTHIMPGRAKNIAHEARQHGDVETNNTTARPQPGTTETAIASAPEKRSKNAYFSPAKAMAASTGPPHRPAKAMAVSLQHRHQRVKATMVSDNRATWPTGSGRSARGP